MPNRAAMTSPPDRLWPRSCRSAASSSRCCAEAPAGRCCCSTASRTSIRGRRFLDVLGRHAEIIAPSHPGFGHSARPDGLRHGLRPRPPLSRRARGAAARQGDARRAVVRRLARRGGRGEVRPSPRPARPRGRARHQGQRPRDARHPGRVQHLAPGGAAAELARSRGVGAGLRRDVGRRARRPRQELGDALSLRLASRTCTTRSSGAGCAASRVPTLVLWGESDGIVSPSYGQAYSRADSRGRASS